MSDVQSLINFTLQQKAHNSVIQPSFNSYNILYIKFLVMTLAIQILYSVLLTTSRSEYGHF